MTVWPLRPAGRLRAVTAHATVPADASFVFPGAAVRTHVAAISAQATVLALDAGQPHGTRGRRPRPRRS